jgi:GT2 family glycosyltransferase
MLRLTEVTGQVQPHSQRDARVDNSDTLENLVLDPPVTASLLYPRALLETINGFDPGLALRDDFDLFVRALIAGYRPQPLTAPIYVYRDHASEGRLSRRTSVADQNALIGMFYKHQALLASAQIPLPELSTSLARTIWVTARNALRLGHTVQACALFDLAKQMSPGAAVRGKLIYRALVCVFGPIRTEYLLQQLKHTSE